MRWLSTDFGKTLSAMTLRQFCMSDLQTASHESTCSALEGCAAILMRQWCWQVSAIFLCCAAAYPRLIEMNHIHWFQFLYYFSSFWGLFGSHTTSFLLAGALSPPAIAAHAMSLSCASETPSEWYPIKYSRSTNRPTGAASRSPLLLCSLAAESFPVAIRGTAHGVSAATGKVCHCTCILRQP